MPKYISMMRGAGASMFPMVTTVTSMIVLRVPAVYLLAHFFGPEYMFYGYGIGWAVALPITLTYYASGRWKRHGLLTSE